ncbi:MAG: hypothetical protein UY28_C0004G0051 [Candidatus Amesbacteria bacterium GW2011_GWB1_48_13]|uniref:Uncharacterized protein n=1 Tax=Candidatus Amesbacteria bacterium GW2011_GWB1_48_13 TaxID=1618362 RepID=A0A0G1X6S2_9BACT|nr:MAG: hypothetical protein UY28_C0004G0051 [Candidatus Amesbacteria bacterium GW2011_GWB1_48_13]
MPPEETDPNAPVKLEAPKPDEQPVHPLDQIFKDEGGDQLHLEHPTLDAGIETPAETAQPAPAEAAPAETSKEEPPKEQPPKEEPPKEQPPVEAKPHPKGPSWKQMKELQKQLKEANQAKEAAEQKLSQRPPAETLLDEELPIEDPLTKVTRDVGDVKATVAQTAEELKRLRANQEQQAVTEQIKVEESTFSRDHADYPKAVQFLVEKRLSHYEKSGRVERAATWEMGNRREVIERYAAETGKDPDDEEQLYEAAREMVGRILIEQDRLELIRDCRETGRSVPGIVYDLAVDFGYQTDGATNPAAPAQPPAKPAAQQRVKRAKEQEAQAMSLSVMQSGGGAPPAEITSRKQILEMDEKELDRYMLDKEKAGDPLWFQRLSE